MPANGAPPTSLSYHPSDPLHVETIGYDHGIWDATSIAANEATLYSPKATLSDVEVGLVSAADSAIAILQKGKLLDMVDVFTDFLGVVQRDGEIHVLSYAEYSEVDQQRASWSATLIAADGTYRQDMVEAPASGHPWNEVSEFHSKTLDSFGLRGWTRFTRDGREQGLAQSWHRDTTKKIHAIEGERHIPIHKRPRKLP